MRKLYAIIFLAFHSLFFTLSAQIISNEAGNNTLGYGYSGNGGLATAAQLHAPHGVSVDTAGNLFITDLTNNVIREVNHSTGIITTAFGNGIAGYSGDGGPATAAELNAPSGGAFDTLGNFYIADATNNRIREVNIATGIITTVAGNGFSGYTGDGGLATAAEIASPTNLAFDRHNNMYIADKGNEVIREINASTGIISTVAGNYAFGAGFSGDGGPATAAELDGAIGIALDTSANLYIADSYNHVIRVVSHSTGIISTIAGNNLFGSGYTGDGGQATAAEISQPEEVWVRKTGILYISDWNNSVIRTVVISTGIINTIAGDYALRGSFSGDGGAATSAGLSYPACTAFNKSGDMYIADDSNQVIRLVNHSTGIITTYSGNNKLGYGYSGDGGIATLAQLHSPNSVEVDAAGNRYIADNSNQVVRKLSGNVITTIAGNYLFGAGYSGDGGAATAAELNNPSDIAVDASGNIYIADFSNNVIRKVSGGIISTVAGNYMFGAGFSGDGGPATAAELNNPSGVAVDSVGNIYIADFSNNVIREVTMSNGIINTVAGNYSLGAGFSGDGGSATSAQLDNPIRVTVGHGMMFVSEVHDGFVAAVKKPNEKRISSPGDGNQDIRGINAFGTINTVAGSHTLGSGFSGDGGPATAAQLNNPTGIAADSRGNLYIADYSNNLIREVSGGIINTIAGNYLYGGGFSGNGGPATAAELNNPAGIAVTDTGLYIADNANQVVRKVNIITTGINTITTPTGGMQIFPNPANNNLFITINKQSYKPESIEVFDVTGKMLLAYNIQNSTSSIQIDVSTLAAGMYIVKVIDSNYHQNIGRFIIAH
jgi:trimeric autotransporter adhesin